MKKQYLFIVNPNASKGKAGRDWHKIERLIRRKDIQYKAVLTIEPNHAINIVEEELRLGYKYIVVVGGDGTLNEVVNGIFTQRVIPPEEIYLGIIPVGTGNDWARYYGLNKKYQKSIKPLFNNNVIFQDVGKITHSIDGKTNTHYFVNIAGFGFDALVVKSTNEMQERGNRLAVVYLFNLLKAAFSYHSIPMHIEINGEQIKKKIFSISIGNGKYSGGGMIQTPEAKINDGLFDVTIYDDMSIWKIIRHIPKLYTGKILNVKGVSSYRTAEIFVHDFPGIYAETDGEIITGGPYQINIIPSALKVFV
jgi:YegS/Rv2252/BmrU family lipid kinase